MRSHVGIMSSFWKFLGEHMARLISCCGEGSESSKEIYQVISGCLRKFYRLLQAQRWLDTFNTRNYGET